MVAHAIAPRGGRRRAGARRACCTMRPCDPFGDHVSVSEVKRPPLRELALGELLDVALKICLAHWRTLLKAVLVVIVPVQIVSTIVTADYTLSSFDVGSNSEQTTREAIDELNRHIDGLLISSLLQILALVFATAACLRAIVSAYLGETPDWRGSLTYALRHAGAAAGAHRALPRRRDARRARDAAAGHLALRRVGVRAAGAARRGPARPGGAAALLHARARDAGGGRSA